MEGLEAADADLTVYVHPSKANKVLHAVSRQLSSLLFTYDDNFDGILLSFDYHIQHRKAKILPGLIPYFGVQLKAKLLLFSPKPDMLLEGKVVKVGKESIHVIVLGFCSAAIMSEDIRGEFKYKIKHGRSVFSSKLHKRHVIKDGSIIRFLVKSLDEEILHISGSLIPAHTGCLYWLAKHATEDGPQVDRSLKRYRQRDAKKEVEDQHSDLSIDVNHSLDNRRPHKSRKRNVED
ncbi:uncharacterized protein A4U43_C08F3160 [Asparagus officinalis]|uniref:uncharacterized protein LOC109820427 n=1 Tax=Asparagus officinalis TaxID=4686 RepID=UPI00098E784D|nr:uncharacterized protein LOC109820427 [Asparagus officinalis]XP_020242158.1 uncharacterized protein LOC109820427 [Asparagus officinalis]ONK59119.1 uncharacterized protein A4U43_C08F3160 [Asparagus officinalis]